MKFEFGVSPKAEFSICKFLIITQEIPHIFCVSTRWNQQNHPILNILNLRLTCLRFCDAPFSIYYVCLEDYELKTLWLWKDPRHCLVIL